MDNKLAQLNDMYAELRAAGRVHTQNDLADYVGVHRSTISAALKGNPKYLTESLLTKIEKALIPVPLDDPLAWRVPLLPLEAHGGSLVDFEGSVQDYECEQVVSPVRGASYAIHVAGDSMAPAYPNGCRVLIQRINEEAFIEWGRVYVLDTENGIVIKQVRKSDEPDRVTCCSLNPAPEFAPFDVEKRYIRGWFRVLMIMSLV